MIENLLRFRPFFLSMRKLLCHDWTWSCRLFHAFVWVTMEWNDRLTRSVLNQYLTSSKPGTERISLRFVFLLCSSLKIENSNVDHKNLRWRRPFFNWPLPSGYKSVLLPQANKMCWWGFRSDGWMELWQKPLFVLLIELVLLIHLYFLVSFTHIHTQKSE